MIHGIINVYKEKGYTSHDVVAKLRGILKQKKIGHTGTLDPDAEGVLPVCLGKGTKLCGMLTEDKKTYQAILLLGKSTDTQDVSGEVLKEAPVTCTIKDVYEAIQSFVGDYQQVPPMYSALKVDGKKLYELAREGKEVEREARPVYIEQILIHEICLPRVSMTVTCSKGTYIRTLCHDIGRKLGCGGCMEQLLRTQAGRFHIEDSLRLREIEILTGISQIQEHIIPVDRMFEEYPAVIIRREEQKYVENGNPFYRRQIVNRPDLSGDMQVRVYDEDREFYAVYQFREKENRFVPVKMFR